MTKPFWTVTRNMPVLAAGDIFMGGYAGPVILMASDLICVSTLSPRSLAPQPIMNRGRRISKYAAALDIQQWSTRASGISR